MSGIGATGIAAILAAQPSLAASVRHIGNDPALAGVVNTALCAGIEQARTQTQQGMLTGADGAVRYAVENEPATWKRTAAHGQAAIVGQRVHVTIAGDTNPFACRVTARKELLGAVRLNLQAEFAET